MYYVINGCRSHHIQADDIIDAEPIVDVIDFMNSNITQYMCNSTSEKKVKFSPIFQKQYVPFSGVITGEAPGNKCLLHKYK